jgi:hypothetical protein
MHIVKVTVRSIRWIMCCLGCVLFAPQVRAESGLFSEETIDIEADFRIAAVDGEATWIDNGFGKLRYGTNGNGNAKAELAAIDVAWKPQLGWIATGLVSITHQAGQEHAIDLNEAFVKLKPVPKGNMQYSARLGLLYPPVSLEHGGPNWSVTNSITPSAINSWIGEEVKVVAAEATVGRDFGSHNVALTGAVFDYNDTSGTLLTYRGWALHDLKATAFGHLRLPPPFASGLDHYQQPHSNPVMRLDKKPGFYARLDWRPPLPVAIHAFRYDNRGDGESARNRQTSWSTQFWELAATMNLGEHTKLLSQAMTGRTTVGNRQSNFLPFDVRFKSAYLMAVHQTGKATLSGRVELFGTRNKGFVNPYENGENGWAVMAAAKYPLSDNFKILVEAQHVSSNRLARSVYSALPQVQDQTLIQSSLRFNF